MIDIIINFTTISVVALQVFAVVLALALLLRRRVVLADRLITSLAPAALGIATVVALAATFGSLFLSSVAGFPPCDLCWWQRIFMYSSAVILSYALITRQRVLVRATTPLLVLGGLVALYHTYLQAVPTTNLALPCDENGISCGTRYIYAFGYLSIPLMALTVFVLILLLYRVASFEHPSFFQRIRTWCAR